jgi:acyl carrier protein
MEAEKTLPAIPSVYALLQFVNEKLLADSDAKMNFDTPLFQDGRIDSLTLLQLIAFLDEQSDRAIPDELIKIAFAPLGRSRRIS